MNADTVVRVTMNSTATPDFIDVYSIYHMGDGSEWKAFETIDTGVGMHLEGKPVLVGWSYAKDDKTAFEEAAPAPDSVRFTHAAREAEIAAEFMRLRILR